jgi:alpha-beta hydrolase superfamily lysophospholipase
MLFAKSFRQIRFSWRLMSWVLRLVGLAAVGLMIMIAVPISRPPVLASVHETASAVDRTGMPELSRFQARDGTDLAYRVYPATAPDAGRIAILTHGSSASSAAMHALAKGLAARGVATYALDIRGHGHSGTRGDIAYIGQLEDDLADFVALVRKSEPTAPITLIGHSSGGAFALRVAGSPIQSLFARTILLSPYLGYDAPTSRPDSGGWAKADVPRFLGIAALERLGITCCGSLPVLAFAVPPGSQAVLTSTYSYRLMRNYATSSDFHRDVAGATKPVTLYAGADDELMLVDKYAEALQTGAATPDVHILPGINHMAIVSDPVAVAAIVDDVATH